MATCLQTALSIPTLKFLGCTNTATAFAVPTAHASTAEDMDVWGRLLCPTASAPPWDPCPPDSPVLPHRPRCPMGISSSRPLTHGRHSSPGPRCLRVRQLCLTDPPPLPGNPGYPCFAPQTPLLSWIQALRLPNHRPIKHSPGHLATLSPTQTWVYWVEQCCPMVPTAPWDQD